MPRARFTVRGLMIAVAVAGALLGAAVEALRLRRRSAEYAALAGRHAANERTFRAIAAAGPGGALLLIAHGPGTRSRRTTPGAEADHEAALRLKYERAARYPWLPVAPDPPEPE
jgi:hypothetical protein